MPKPLTGADYLCRCSLGHVTYQHDSTMRESYLWSNKESFTKRVAINSAQLPISHNGIIFSDFNTVCVCVIRRTCADMMHKS